MEEGLFEKTGKKLDHWVDVVKKSGIEKHNAIISYLIQEHGFTHGYANFVSLKSRKSDAGSFNESDLLKNQYKGKEELIPIYEELVKVCESLGTDVIRTPKKDSVSMIRKRQFALIKPATKTRIDLGLKIKGKPITDRLENSGPFGAMCTHRVRLSNLEEVNKELIGWIKEAYDGAE